MSRVIIFSTKFPSYHPKVGQPTYFVEKIFAGLIDARYPNFEIAGDFKNYDWYKYYNCTQPKFHTIRAGHRFKVGDYFSPRIWSDKPYRSKQIIIAPDIEVKKVWNVEIFTALGCIYIGKRVNKNRYELYSFGTVAQNDGLTFEDMQHWFNVKPDKPFIGQIICWNDDINY